MSNQELKKIIDDAIRSGSLEKFNSAVQKVAIDRISALGLDEELRLKIRDRIENFTVPVKLRTEVSTPEAESITKKKYLFNALVGVVFGLIMMAAVTYTEWWSILICVLVIEGYFIWLNRRRNAKEKCKPEIETVIDANSGNVMNEIESFVDIIRKVYAAGSSVSNEKDKNNKGGTSLYNDYPNVVKWLQNLYAAQHEFNEAGRQYLFTIVPLLLDQMYYDVVKYNGNNIELFEIDHNSRINEPTLIYPAIVDTRSGKAVLKGKVCTP